MHVGAKCFRRPDSDVASCEQRYNIQRIAKCCNAKDRCSVTQQSCRLQRLHARSSVAPVIVWYRASLPGSAYA